MNALQDKPPSSAALWPPLARFIKREQAIAERIARRKSTAFLYEFLRFGMKQAWACLFGGIVIGLLVATAYFYPRGAWLARYDFLFLAMLAVQAALLVLKLETFDEAKVILIYHVVGTAMEIFKTSAGSWIYPEPSFFRIAGVPLFTGFMYSCIGSYICRSWRLFDFRFTHHPSRAVMIALSIAIYVNFFAHHYIWDMRWLLFVASALAFWRTMIYYKIWRRYRSMPLLLGFVLVAVFIWFSENIGTVTKTWLYPSQLSGWSVVPMAKLGSWFLLLIISYTLVTLINRPEPMLPQTGRGGHDD